MLNCCHHCDGFSSPQEDAFETVSWDIFNLSYGSPKTRAAMFHQLNKIIPSIMDEMTVYERTELIKLVLKQQDRRRALGMDLFSVNDITLLTLQSEEIDAGSEITGNSHNAVSGEEEQEVIVRYLDENPGTKVDHNPILDDTFNGDFVADHALSHFLSRPQVISTITWAEGAALNTNLDPWDAFFNSTQVKKKLDNFSRINCNLHLKIILNASPFYYGAGLASYIPNYGFNDTTVSPALTNNGDAYTCCLSQRPHIWFYPQTNQGGEMTLPFLYHKSWLDINVRGDVQQMGGLQIRSPTVLQNANSVVGAGVTIQIYAWATNVKLCGPTSLLSMQSDEYGIVSGPASAVANIARKLSAIPMIGPYARATDMIASGVGSLAKLFGFTNVPIIEDVKPIKNVPFHAFSSCEISQPIEKLTIDPKNELSIDSRICGHDGVDELLISNFVQREAYVLQATWAASHVTGQVLVRSNVIPDLKVIEPHVASYVQGTPMSHAASLFKYWRGDIIYRFRFICSKFHRGRVLIQWDPNAYIGGAIDTNIVHSEIVDLSTDTDVEFRVPYLARTPFLRNSVRTNDATSWDRANIVGTGTIAGYNKNQMNGTINLSVLTQQTSPVASADVQILVSVRGAENLTLAAPQGPPTLVSYFDLQSEEFDYDNTRSFGMTSKGPVLDDNIFTVAMGERITSLRQLLRRTMYHRGWLLTTTPSTTAVAYYSSTHAQLPLSFGYDPNGINSADSTITPGTPKPFNFVNNTYLTWIGPCFVGYRGGINWHYNTDDTHWINTMKAARYYGPTSGADYALAQVPSVASLPNFARSSMQLRIPGGFGCAITNTRTQAGLSAYYPMYSSFRMKTPNVKTTVLGSAQDESDTDKARVEVTLQPHSSSNPSAPSVDFYVSCGTDYNPIFFLNVPTYIVYGVLPTAT